MLLLSSLHNLLQQVLSLPDLHTAVLFTPEGQLVSYASDSSTPKDEIRVFVGVSGEVWQETKQNGMGMVDSEVCEEYIVHGLGLTFIAIPDRSHNCSSGASAKRQRRNKQGARVRGRRPCDAGCS
jgi:hypothetical protein